MKNTSPLKFLLQNIVIIFTLLQLFGLIYIFLNYSTDWVLLSLSFTTILVLIFVSYRFRRELLVLDKINTTVKEYVKGDFANRKNLYQKNVLLQKFQKP